MRDQRGRVDHFSLIHRGIEPKSRCKRPAHRILRTLIIECADIEQIGYSNRGRGRDEARDVRFLGSIVYNAARAQT